MKRKCCCDATAIHDVAWLIIEKHDSLIIDDANFTLNSHHFGH